MVCKFTVPSLSYRVQTALGNSIFRLFTSQHRNCTDCVELTVPGDVCETLGKFREELQKLPAYAFDKVMTIVFNKVAADDEDFELIPTTLNFFFPFQLFKICRIRMSDVETFIGHSGQIEHLHVFDYDLGHKWSFRQSGDIYYNTLLLSDLLQMTQRLKILCIHSLQVNVRSFLVAISRNCHNIRELHQICFTEEITEFIIKLFCYQDWPLGTEKNPCCQSIQIFDVYRKLQYVDPTKSEIKGLAELCENLTNLKSFGDMFQVQKVLSRITESDSYDASKLRNSLLTLKSASFNDIFADVDRRIPYLKDFSELEHLHLRKTNSHPDYLIVDVISEKLVELVYLELELSEKVNLSKICSKCPNLIKLGLNLKAPGCVNISEGNHMTFKSLEYFWICLDATEEGISYDWLRLVSPNIQSMCIAIRNDQLGEEALLATMEENSFPNLETAQITKHTFSEVGIKRLFDHCPVLESLFSEFPHLNLRDITTDLKELFGEYCELYTMDDDCCFYSHEIHNYCEKWAISNISDCC